ncbi:MAG: hypothetical protein IIZ78_15130 [Clostridiales bacterium]|jgi:phosphatidylethanolamine-binding protein (PEBP) family uncharacterized protein|nr:hypothetical protein [Clostridiales bacterium]MBQ5768279.1 hypothetical protein [Clostridiales bacterium]
MKKIIALIICGALMLPVAGCSNNVSVSSENTEAQTTTVAAQTEASAADNSDDQFVSAYPAFAVTSESLDGNVWIESCSNTDGGENASPELSWEPVDGAAVYVIYMVDINANNFLHWKSADVTETSLHQGWAPSSDYVGPYPPSGQTHQYNIYVFALKAPVERVKGSINTPAAKIQEFMDSLDTDANGNTGNIVAVGRITGKYTAK